MKRASIDLGTNTCLLLIEEVSSEGSTILHDESNVVRLGQGVDKAGEFNPEAMERAKKCLIHYANIAKNFGVDPKTILAVGTAQARDSRNAKAFFASVELECGIRFRILTGDEEAKATFLGAALPGIKTSQMVVLDIGGGSTELVAMPDASSGIAAGIFGESVNIGAVRMTERYLKSDPVTDDEFWECEDIINQSIEHLCPWRKSLPAKMKSEPTLVAVAGTAVTLAMLQESMTSYDREALDGMILTQGDVHRLVEELKWRTIIERQAMTGMEVKRADVLLAGALIFWRVMEVLDFKEARISTRGLRYGVFHL
jgi:exopolyphosphatase/guanosine-5'-triphosphate,3'-diphosphate pyrophosphatase